MEPERPTAERVTADAESPLDVAPWEIAVAMTLLWIIPVAAFVLVMFQIGIHGS